MPGTPVVLFIPVRQTDSYSPARDIAIIQFSMERRTETWNIWAGAGFSKE
jgi:hypothetical protein